jgi:uracil phosphoribosyltransferase
MGLVILEHPLAKHLLTELRDRKTPPTDFRRACNHLTTLIAIEATRTMRTRIEVVQTPLIATDGHVLDQPLAIVPVLRAGLGMIAPFTELFPEVAVGYIGLERNEQTAIARSYYQKLPNLSGKKCLCLDPMLATGGSACQAICSIKDAGAEDVSMVCIVAAPDGVANLQNAHPDVSIYTAALDDSLNDVKYIVPGLGDFGDRLFSTQ